MRIESYFFFHYNNLSSVVFLVTIIMRFLAFVLLAATFVPITVTEDLFSDSLPDISAFQDSPQGQLASQDLFASQNLPEDSDLTTNDDNDLFAGSNPVDFSSTEPQDFSPSELEASCPTDEGQSLNKLRSRDGAVCSPEGPAALKKEPTQDKLGDIFRKIKEFFEYPPDEDWGPYPRFPPAFRKCRPDFPHHLCCNEPGDRTLEITVPGSGIYAYFFGCYIGSWDFFHK